MGAFSFRGTLGRLGFTLRVVPALLVAISAVKAGGGAAAWAAVPAAWIVVAAFVRRLRDCGWPWWVVLYVLPFAKLGLALLFLACALAPRRSHGAAWMAGQSADVFVALFSMLGRLAKADGRVTQAEIDVVQRFMDDAGLPRETQVAAIGAFDQGKDDPRDIGELARAFVDVQPDEGVRVMTYRVLVEVAFADGELGEAERRMLRELPRHLRISSAYYEQFVGTGRGARPGRRAGGPDPAECYAILGCPPDASDEELKRAYRSATKKFHPDTLASKGLPEEFTAFALEQTQALNVAYETITRERARARVS